jgi:hypothetical protein
VFLYNGVNIRLGFGVLVVSSLPLSLARRHDVGLCWPHANRAAGLGNLGRVQEQIEAVSQSSVYSYQQIEAVCGKRVVDYAVFYTWTLVACARDVGGCVRLDRPTNVSAPRQGGRHRLSNRGQPTGVPSSRVYVRVCIIEMTMCVSLSLSLLIKMFCCPTRWTGALSCLALPASHVVINRVSYSLPPRVTIHLSNSAVQF